MIVEGHRSKGKKVKCREAPESQDTELSNTVRFGEFNNLEVVIADAFVRNDPLFLKCRIMVPQAINNHRKNFEVAMIQITMKRIETFEHHPFISSVAG